MNEQSEFVINLIPSSKDDKILTNIKHYFYTHDFKYTSKGLPSRPHLTVAKFKGASNLDNLKEELTQLCFFREPLTLPVHSVTDEVTQTQKYPNGEGWVALVFDAHQLRDLFYKIDAVLTKYQVNQNDNYINAIRAIKGDHLTTFDCIANHVNLCNRCKPEKVAEAKDYIESCVPSVITFDKLIIRDTSSEEELIVFEVFFKQMQNPLN